jgi:hypothetical protein
VIHEGEDTLRNRAAAAISRRRLKERLKQRDKERWRCAHAYWLLREVLGVEAGVNALPVELDGLEFDVDRLGEEWVLYLARPCRASVEGTPSDMCVTSRLTPIRSLADLGEALEEPVKDYCAWCSD